MKLKIIIITALSVVWSTMQAQEAAVPKWGSKAMKAIVSVLTYDKDNNLLNSGTGFYINTEGVAIADYHLFKDAYNAVVVDVNGDKSPVKWILGADDTYSIVKFKVDTKKNVALTKAESP